MIKFSMKSHTNISNIFKNSYICKLYSLIIYRKITDEQNPQIYKKFPIPQL